MKKSKAFKYFLLFLFFCSCGEKETQIPDVSGNAILKIVNECEYQVTIYFDTVKLGEIEKEGERTWNVLAGQHTIKATCLGADAYEEELVFTDNQTTELHLSIVIKSEQLRSTEKNESYSTAGLHLAGSEVIR